MISKVGNLDKSINSELPTQNWQLVGNWMLFLAFLHNYSILSRSREMGWIQFCNVHPQNFTTSRKSSEVGRGGPCSVYSSLFYQCKAPQWNVMQSFENTKHCCIKAMFFVPLYIALNLGKFFAFSCYINQNIAIFASQWDILTMLFNT